MDICTNMAMEEPILMLTGRLDGDGATTLDIWCARQDTLPIIWDVAGLTFVSSAGIRSLLKYDRQLRAKGQQPKVIGLTPIIRDILSIAGLLDHWSFYPSIADAIATIPKQPVDWLSIIGDSGQTYGYRKGGVPLQQTQFKGATETDFIPVSLRELGVSIGVGGLGSNAEEARQNAGMFLSTGDLVTLLTHTGNRDFMHTVAPERTFVFINWALRLSGEGGHIYDGATELTLAAIKDDLRGFQRSNTMEPSFIACISCEINNKHTVIVRTSATETMPWTGLQGNQPLPTGGMPSFAAAVDVLKTDEEVAFIPLDSAAIVTKLRIWFNEDAALQDGNAERLVIEAAESLPMAWELIIRSIFAEASCVCLKRLTGGFTASTFAADAYDRYGRRTLPTVVKISPYSIAKREEEAYHTAVRPFILNNATVLFGKASHGDFGGLRYNFVGITGAESKLTPLETIYVSGDLGDALSIVEQTMQNVLEPWYGQAKPMQVQPFKDHDMRGLFPNLPMTAQRSLGISADEPFIYSAILGRDVVNPFWFIQHHYDTFLEHTVTWNAGITHGDLNFNNVLVDERRNIYVIDFSETRVRNVASDFARLEAIALMQYTRLNESNDEAVLLRMLETFLAGDLYHPVLPDRPGLDNPMLMRAIQLTETVRRLARHRLGKDTYDAPYLFPLFQWVVPIVAFEQFGMERKRLSALSAGLILERLLLSLGLQTP